MGQKRRQVLNLVPPEIPTFVNLIKLIKTALTIFKLLSNPIFLLSKRWCLLLMCNISAGKEACKLMCIISCVIKHSSTLCTWVTILLTKMVEWFLSIFFTNKWNWCVWLTYWNNRFLLNAYEYIYDTYNKTTFLNIFWLSVCLILVSSDLEGR